MKRIAAETSRETTRAAGRAHQLRELAQRLGESPERLLEWRASGLIGRSGGELLAPEDLERARLVQMLVRRGITLDVITPANDHEATVDRVITLMFPDGVGPLYSLEEAAARLGIAVDAVRRLWEACAARVP